MLTTILPLLKAVGLNPERQARKFSRGQVEARFVAALPAVLARLEKDGLTPDLKAVDPRAERQFIRSTMYLLLKQSWPLRQGASLAGDFLRDQYDDAVVESASAEIEPSTSTLAAVTVIANHLLDRMF